MSHPAAAAAADPNPGGPPPGRGEWIRLFVIVVVAFAAGSLLAWNVFGSDAGPAFFYPPAGVTVAAMILSRRRLWPAVVAGIFSAEMLVDILFQTPLLVSVGFALANTIEPVVGASLVLAWCGGRPDLGKRRDFAAFIVGAVVLGPLSGCLIGGSLKAVTIDAGSPWLSLVLNWWAGDALGVLVVAAPILLWATQSHFVRRRPWETVAILVVAMMVSFAGFWTTAPPALLILPVLGWAALRLDMLGAALAGAVVAFLVNLTATRGRGLFANIDVSLTTRVALTQVFIATIVVVTMLIAQESRARESEVEEHEAERRERIRLETLSRLARKLSAALTPQDIGRALEEEVIAEVGVQALSLGAVGLDARTLEWVSGYPRVVLEKFGDSMPLSERTVATDVVRGGQPIIIPTSAEYAQIYPDKVHWAQLSGAESTVGWPLTSAGKPVGVMLLVWTDPQPLDSDQLDYVAAVANMVSQALVRAQVYADERARAVVLQSAVLPTTPAEVSGLDICVTYEPADVEQGLGGDWYDLMPLPGNRTFLAVGDVIGHGMPAVEDMAQLRSAGRALAHQGMAPAQLMAELNGFTRDASHGKFATMAVAIYDRDEQSLCYSSAGHPPPLLRRSATGEVSRLEDAHGPVLGPLPGARFTDATVPVEPGDILLMYTDGLVERRGADVDTGICAAERIIAEWSPDVAIGSCCSVLQDQLAPRPRADDVCVIAVRFTPGDEGPPEVGSRRSGPNL